MQKEGTGRQLWKATLESWPETASFGLLPCKASQERVALVSSCRKLARNGQRGKSAVQLSCSSSRKEIRDRPDSFFAAEISVPAPESIESGNRALVDYGAQNRSEEEAVWQA